MAIVASDDPARVTRFELKHRRGFEAAALFGAVVFVALSAWMLSDAEISGAQQAAALLGIAFFGWAGVVMVQRMRRGASVLLSHQGLHYAFAPHYATRRLVAWSDIEGFGIKEESGSEFNVVTLKTTAPLVRQFSEAEAAATLAIFRRVMWFGGATVVVAGANLKIGKAVKAAQMLSGSGTLASLADMLRFSREKFGGEICLGWPDRDRGAAEFQALLTAWKDFSDRRGSRSAPVPARKTGALARSA
jgi:hypothetical protein